jgi:hypothetical protein
MLRLHGEEEESFTHQLNEFAFQSEFVIIPVILIGLLTWFIWNQNKPPKGKHSKVDRDY